MVKKRATTDWKKNGISQNKTVDLTEDTTIVDDITILGNLNCKNYKLIIDNCVLTLGSIAAANGTNSQQTGASSSTNLTGCKGKINCDEDSKIVLNSGGEIDIVNGEITGLISCTCFPFDAIATTLTGKKRCEDLVVGEHVLVDHKGTFEPILFFGHRENQETLFVELTLENGKTMSASPLHYIFSYNNGKKTMVFMKDIVNGDYVKYMGKRVKVSDISYMNKKGFVSPHTKSHEIVINGVQASCYASEKFVFANNVAVNVADSLGVTIPLQLIDPIREIGSAVINKFNL